MSLDMDSVREQLAVRVQRDAIVEPTGPVDHCQVCGGYLGAVSSKYGKYNDECQCMPCFHCGETIPQQDYRVPDDDGNVYHIECAEKLLGKMETDNG